MSAGVSDLATPYIGKGTSGDPALGTFEAAIVGGTTSVLGGGKFANGAITAAFGYLDNYCNHEGRCWITPQEKAVLDTGNAAAFDKMLCADGDPYYCFGLHIAAGDNGWGFLAGGWLSQQYAVAHTTQFNMEGVPIDGWPTQETTDKIALALATAYANYLGYSEANAKVPTLNGITQTHYNVFAQFGMGPAAFGGTPLGNFFPNVQTWITGHFIPGWCPKCQ